MDEREAMAMSGAASFYMHRGFGASGWQPGLHTPQQGIRSFPSPNPSLPLQSSDVAGGSVSSAFHGESLVSVSPPVGVNTGSQGGVTQGEAVKKKRGRPRKYGPDGMVATGRSSISTSWDPESGAGLGSVSGLDSATPTQKRGRGRPPGTGKKQQLASCGELVSSTAGMGFTPHILMFSMGEDIAAKIASFSQQGPRVVCILSATGAVSIVTLNQSATSVTYEGRFEILSLAGTYLPIGTGEPHGRNATLSISLSSPNGRVIGGVVTGPLIAACKVQVIMGTFFYCNTKLKNKTKSGREPITQNEPPIDEEKETSPPCAAQQPNQNLNHVLTGWPGSSLMDMRSLHTDIDLTRG